MADPGDPGDKPRRAHARYDVDWRVSLRCVDWDLAAQVAAANASRGGLFVLNSRPPAIGTRVILTVELPNGTTMTLEGTVQHQVTAGQAAASGQSPGVGVKFDQKHTTDLFLLEQMAASAGDRPKTRTLSQPPLEMPPLETRLSRPILAQIPVVKRFVRPQGEVLPVLGMHLGATHAVLSAAVGDRVFVVPDEQGRALLPAVVHVPREGEPLVGWDARERLADAPRRTVPGAALFLGKAGQHPEVATRLAAAAFKTLAAEDGSLVIDLEGVIYTPERLCAEIIRHLAATGERQLGVPVEKVVLTVPAASTEPEWAAAQRAAHGAGLEVVAMVREPVAAALAHWGGKARTELAAIYDLGGSGFDFTLVEFTGFSHRILATGGDARLGGDELDLAIARAVADAFWRTTGIELRQRFSSWLRLLAACEKARRELSTETETRIVVPRLLEELDLKQPFDREVLDRLLGGLVEHTFATARAVLAEAGITPAKVTQVLAVGGCARMPLVRTGLARLFDRDLAPIASPDEATALGAAQQARRG